MDEAVASAPMWLEFNSGGVGFILLSQSSASNV